MAVTLGRTTRTFTVALVLASSPGCSQLPSGVRPVGVDADQAAMNALEVYDSDGDHMLSRAELKPAPELALIYSSADSNGDTSLDHSELAKSFGTWANSSSGLTQQEFVVRIDGRPLSGATVVFTPASYLGDNIHEAIGVTGTNGGGQAGVAPDLMPDHLKAMRLLAPGLYRVSITHPTRSIPEQYNSRTQLGAKVPAEGQTLVWDLKSR